MKETMRYLLVTHIAYAQADDGSVVLSSLWGEDLKGLVASVGPVTVAAPKLPSVQSLLAWGPGTMTLTPSDGVTFVALPVHTSRFDLTFPFRTRRALRRAAMNADLVHTSNLFDPYTTLYHAHDVAVRHNKKTLFVVAEDFYDMLNWEWVRPTRNPFQKFRRQRALRSLDEQVRKRVASASLTFLHTPAAVARYREFAANAVAIRQPVHESSDVIDADCFAAKCTQIRSGAPLKLVVACRMEPLKGIDFFLRAIALLKDWNIPVHATLYGGGKYAESYKLLAQKLGIADIAQFPGTVSPGPELRNALAAAHIFLMPHLTSDFGRAFFDAIAAATPVIAYRSVASQDTVRHRVDGLIVPNAYVESLADGIAQFHADREFLVRCAEAARSRALVNTKAEWNRFRAQMIHELF
jgi:glycosyltransferase involved in cell wall biosynthesis